MNESYRYSNNNVKNKTDYLTIFTVVGMIALGIISLVGYFLINNYINKRYYGVEEEKITLLKEYNDIDNYSFKLSLYYTNDDNVVIDAIGNYNKKSNLEECNFMYGKDEYNVKTDYNTGVVSIYDGNNVLISSSKTNAKYTLNLENIITKIRNESDDAVDLGDNHYSVKIDTNKFLDDIYADVYVKDGFITKVRYDLSNVLSSSGYKKYIVIFELYDYNS